MHISYFIYTHSVGSFLKSLLALPGLNAQGLTSKQSHKVPWGNQYKIDGIYSLYDRDYDEAEYDEYECYYDDCEEYEEQVVEHLSHQGWVRL